MTKPPRELHEFLYRYDPALQSLALGLRQLVLEEMAPCHEYIFAMRSKVVMLYSVTDKVIKDSVCQVGVFTRHVTLAFPRGADLNDRRGVLAGAGKKMRHLRLSRLTELDRPELRSYIREARRRASRVARGLTPEGVVTRVKRSSPRPAWPRMPW